MAKIRVLIADDHGLMREGVKALLAATDDIEVVGEAEDGDEAVREVRRLEPDVVLMDVAMPGLGGLEATLVIRKEKPDVKILVLTQYDDREYVSRFLKAGVSGLRPEEGRGRRAGRGDPRRRTAAGWCSTPRSPARS